ncbi:MAG: pentapeptide repeat-containing protein, partial [Nocardioides sp.]
MTGLELYLGGLPAAQGMVVVRRPDYSTARVLVVRGVRGGQLRFWEAVTQRSVGSLTEVPVEDGDSFHYLDTSRVAEFGLEPMLEPGTAVGRVESVTLGEVDSLYVNLPLPHGSGQRYRVEYHDAAGVIEQLLAGQSLDGESVAGLAGEVVIASASQLVGPVREVTAVVMAQVDNHAADFLAACGVLPPGLAPWTAAQRLAAMPVTSSIVDPRTRQLLGLCYGPEVTSRDGEDGALAARMIAILAPEAVADARWGQQLSDQLSRWLGDRGQVNQHVPLAAQRLAFGLGLAVHDNELEVTPELVAWAEDLVGASSFPMLVTTAQTLLALQRPIVLRYRGQFQIPVPPRGAGSPSSTSVEPGMVDLTGRRLRLTPWLWDYPWGDREGDAFQLSAAARMLDLWFQVHHGAGARHLVVSADMATRRHYGAIALVGMQDEDRALELRLVGRDLRSVDLAGCRLCRADLRGFDLYGADLMGTDFSHANLSEAVLSWADLTEADLSEANLAGAELHQAQLSRANLYRANLAGSDLTRARLAGSNLTEANLERADLRGADVSGTGLSRTMLRDRGAIVDVTTSTDYDDDDGPTTGGNSRAESVGDVDDERTRDWRSVDWRVEWPLGSDSGVHAPGGAGFFVGKDLSGGVFAGMDLSGVSFAGAVLRGADFTGANLRDADFTGAVLTGASLANADLTGAVLSSAVLLHADLHGSDWSTAVLDGVVLDGAVLAAIDDDGREVHPAVGMANLAGVAFAGTGVGIGGRGLPDSAPRAVLRSLPAVAELRVRGVAADGRGAVDWALVEFLVGVLPPGVDARWAAAARRGVMWTVLEDDAGFVWGAAWGEQVSAETMASEGVSHQDAVWEPRGVWGDRRVVGVEQRLVATLVDRIEQRVRLNHAARLVDPAGNDRPVVSDALPEWGLNHRVLWQGRRLADALTLLVTDYQLPPVLAVTPRLVAYVSGLLRYWSVGGGYRVEDGADLGEPTAVRAALRLLTGQLPGTRLGYAGVFGPELVSPPLAAVNIDLTGMLVTLEAVLSEGSDEAGLWGLRMAALQRPWHHQVESRIVPTGGGGLLVLSFEELRAGGPRLATVLNEIVDRRRDVQLVWSEELPGAQYGIASPGSGLGPWLIGRRPGDGVADWWVITVMRLFLGGSGRRHLVLTHQRLCFLWDLISLRAASDAVVTATATRTLVNLMVFSPCDVIRFSGVFPIDAMGEPTAVSDPLRLGAGDAAGGRSAGVDLSDVAWQAKIVADTVPPHAAHDPWGLATAGRIAPLLAHVRDQLDAESAITVSFDTLRAGGPYFASALLAMREEDPAMRIIWAPSANQVVASPHEAEPSDIDGVSDPVIGPGSDWSAWAIDSTTVPNSSALAKRCLAYLLRLFVEDSLVVPEPPVRPVAGGIGLDPTEEDHDQIPLVRLRDLVVTGGLVVFAERLAEYWRSCGLLSDDGVTTTVPMLIRQAIGHVFAELPEARRVIQGPFPHALFPGVQDFPPVAADGTYPPVVVPGQLGNHPQILDVWGVGLAGRISKHYGALEARIMVLEGDRSRLTLRPDDLDSIRDEVFVIALRRIARDHRALGIVLAVPSLLDPAVELTIPIPLPPAAADGATSVIPAVGADFAHALERWLHDLLVDMVSPGDLPRLAVTSDLINLVTSVTQILRELARQLGSVPDMSWHDAWVRVINRLSVEMPTLVVNYTGAARSGLFAVRGWHRADVMLTGVELPIDIVAQASAAPSEIVAEGVVPPWGLDVAAAVRDLTDLVTIGDADQPPVLWLTVDQLTETDSSLFLGIDVLRRRNPGLRVQTELLPDHDLSGLDLRDVADHSAGRARARRLADLIESGLVGDVSPRLSVALWSQFARAVALSWRHRRMATGPRRRTSEVLQQWDDGEIDRLLAYAVDELVARHPDLVLAFEATERMRLPAVDVPARLLPPSREIDPWGLTMANRAQEQGALLAASATEAEDTGATGTIVVPAGQVATGGHGLIVAAAQWHLRPGSAKLVFEHPQLDELRELVEYREDPDRSMVGHWLVLTPEVVNRVGPELVAIAQYVIAAERPDEVASVRLALDGSFAREQLLDLDLRAADLRRCFLMAQQLHGLDLSFANLAGMNLFNTNLAGANLSGANLIGAGLPSADLTNASLRSANLTRAYLERANARRVDFTNAVLDRVSMADVTLIGADLSETVLTEANLTGADVTDVIWPAGGPAGVDLLGAFGLPAEFAHLASVRLMPNDDLDADHLDGNGPAHGGGGRAESVGDGPVVRGPFGSGGYAEFYGRAMGRVVVPLTWSLMSQVRPLSPSRRAEVMTALAVLFDALGTAVLEPG